MKISTRVDLGIIALADIAINSNKGVAVSASEIAQRQSISQKYLEQVIVGLRQGGFVKGLKGSRGGYMLSRPADKIYLSEVLNALDNNILADTYDAEQENEIRESVNSCLWEKLNGYLRKFTESMTLADLIKQCRSDCEANMYYI